VIDGADATGRDEEHGCYGVSDPHAEPGLPP
jgi:hypothetical protein